MHEGEHQISTIGDKHIFPRQQPWRETTKLSPKNNRSQVTRWRMGLFYSFTKIVSVMLVASIFYGSGLMSELLKDEVRRGNTGVRSMWCKKLPQKRISCFCSVSRGIFSAPFVVSAFSMWCSCECWKLTCTALCRLFLNEGIYTSWLYLFQNAPLFSKAGKQVFE